jgi:hypothetical protein
MKTFILFDGAVVAVIPHVEGREVSDENGEFVPANEYITATLMSNIMYDAVDSKYDVTVIQRENEEDLV